MSNMTTTVDIGNMSNEELLHLYKKIKKNIVKYNNLQFTRKIMLNSLYGALSNQYFRWYDFDLAEAITTSGQLTIKWAEKTFNEYLNNLLKTKNVDYVIAMDTDSCYVCMNELVKRLGIEDRHKIVKALSEFCDKKIQQVLNESFIKLANKMHAYAQKMHMKREAIAINALWRAKKMYVLNVLDLEGVTYDSPILKIQGIEAVRSSTPKFCREGIKQALKIMLNENEEALIKFIDDFKNNFMNKSYQDISYPRSVNDLEKYQCNSNIYKKGTPIHVRGSLLYNYYISKIKTKNYPQITNGDKIRFIYLREPNTINENVIAYIESIPEELKLEKYIDKQKMYEKLFLEPVKEFSNIMKFNIEKQDTLESFFF